MQGYIEALFATYQVRCFYFAASLRSSSDAQQPDGKKFYKVFTAAYQEYLLVAQAITTEAYELIGRADLGSMLAAGCPACFCIVSRLKNERRVVF